MHQRGAGVAEQVATARLADLGRVDEGQSNGGQSNGVSPRFHDFSGFQNMTRPGFYDVGSPDC